MSERPYILTDEVVKLMRKMNFKEESISIFTSSEEFKRAELSTNNDVQKAQLIMFFHRLIMDTDLTVVDENHKDNLHAIRFILGARGDTSYWLRDMASSILPYFREFESTFFQ